MSLLEVRIEIIPDCSEIEAFLKICMSACSAYLFVSLRSSFIYLNTMIMKPKIKD